MKRALPPCLLGTFVIIVVVSFLTIADHPPVSPDATAMTYTEWCQYMDQLTQNLRSVTATYWTRYSIDLAVELVGVVIFFRSLFRTGTLGWQQLIGGLLALGGAVDFVVYTFPPYYETLHDYKMWKEAGASRMWLYPCTASTGDR